MEFRHELKHKITLSDLIAIRQRLRAVAYPDPHAANGKYLIRSLYFDNLDDKALREKLDGIERREKFRIRIYNSDTSFIRLEKKSKLNDLSNKQSVQLTEKQARAIVDGDTEWMINSKHALIRELYAKMSAEGLAPKTIVDYTREPFVFPAGNVRVTIDYDIRSGLLCTDLFNWDRATVPVIDTVILEVKWDAFLPDIIKDAVMLENRRDGAFSKYAACRIYG